MKYSILHFNETCKKEYDLTRCPVCNPEINVKDNLAEGRTEEYYKELCKTTILKCGFNHKYYKTDIIFVAPKFSNISKQRIDIDELRSIGIITLEFLPNNRGSHYLVSLSDLYEHFLRENALYYSVPQDEAFKLAGLKETIKGAPKHIEEAYNNMIEFQSDKKRVSLMCLRQLASFVLQNEGANKEKTLGEQKAEDIVKGNPIFAKMTKIFTAINKSGNRATHDEELDEKHELYLDVLVPLMKSYLDIRYTLPSELEENLKSLEQDNDSLDEILKNITLKDEVIKSEINQN